ncbi:ribonuclease H-like domain-containing protein, partial [Tanacetum coccineum]
RKLYFDAKELVGFDKTKVECYNCHKTEHFTRECRLKGNQDARRIDAGNSRYKAKDNGRRPGKQEESKALVTLDAEESYTKLKKLYDEQREQLGDASIEIQAYTQALKKVEAQLVAYQQNQLWYKEKISQMSVRNKAGLGCGDQVHEGILSYEKEVFQSVFNSRDLHPFWTCIPSGPDKEIDDSLFSYGPKQSKPSESDARSSDFNSCESNCSEETLESMPEPVVNEPKVVTQPKVWSDVFMRSNKKSISDDLNSVSLPTKEQETPSFAFINTVKVVKLLRQTVKEQTTCSQIFSHLIRDCDFHEKRMAKQAELNKRMCKGTGQRENRPVWNNVQRVNHQNQFVPTADTNRMAEFKLICKASSTNNVNTARHNFNSQAVPTNAARKVHTVKPIVNNVRPKTVFHKTHSPIRRPFNRTTTPRTNFSNQKVNLMLEVKQFVLIGGKGKLLLSPQQVVIGDPKDITGTKSPNTMVDQILENDYPQRALKNKGIVDSGCSRHMTRNKAYLAEYQDYNGGPVAFGGSKGYITGKGKIKTRKLDFEDVCFVKELQHFNLFSVSQMCDKKNKVLFTDTECLVLSPDFKLPDENQVLLRVPRQNNMYSFNLENIVPSGGLACLIAKATVDESNKWHRRLGHVNFKNLNKLVKGNLVRGLPSKIFQNDHTCVACQKGKQHKASFL